MIKSSGYRVQAYAGNNTRQAKNEAYPVASRVKEYFPELTVYTSFNPPRWLCRVGDFRSIEEADAMMRQLKSTGVFKEVSIVKTRSIFLYNCIMLGKEEIVSPTSGGIEETLS